VSNALRSTIAIGVIWLVLLLVGGWYVYYKQVDDLEVIREENQEAHEAFDEMQVKVDGRQEVRATLAKLQDQWFERKKVIPVTENARTSYNYFNWLGQQSGSMLMYDFIVLSEDPDESPPSRTYQLRGEDSYENLFNFAYYLEHHPMLYKIERFTIDSASIAEDDEGDVRGVRFDMHVIVYYGSSSSLDQSYSPRVVAAPPKQIDPFYPLVLDKLPQNPKGLVLVDESRLQALTGSTAFIIDQKGKLVSLQVGDEVYLGYLTKIDAQQNKCVFTLNLGGIIEKYTMRLNFENQKGGK
jgi:Tfp pilus assembly protein PilO